VSSRPKIFEPAAIAAKTRRQAAKSEVASSSRPASLTPESAPSESLRSRSAPTPRDVLDGTWRGRRFSYSAPTPSCGGTRPTLPPPVERTQPAYRSYKDQCRGFGDGGEVEVQPERVYNVSDRGSDVRDRPRALQSSRFPEEAQRTCKGERAPAYCEWIASRRGHDLRQEGLNVERQGAVRISLSNT
jgi:hypothetical protein